MSVPNHVCYDVHLVKECEFLSTGSIQTHAVQQALHCSPLCTEAVHIFLRFRHAPRHIEVSRCSRRVRVAW